MNKVNSTIFKLSTIALIGLVSINAFGMDSGSNSDKKDAAPVPKSTWTESFNTAKEAVTDFFHYERLKGKFDSARETVWQNLLKPYPTKTDMNNDEYAHQIQGVIAAKTSAENAALAAKTSDATASDKVKSQVLGIYAMLREFPLHHGYIGNTLWYSGLAAVVAGTGYSVYKLYRLIRPADVKGPFDGIRNVSKLAMNFAIEQSEAFDDTFSLKAQLSKGDTEQLQGGLIFLETANQKDADLLLSYITSFEEAIKSKDINLIKESFKVLNNQVNVANKLFITVFEELLKKLPKIASEPEYIG